MILFVAALLIIFFAVQAWKNKKACAEPAPTTTVIKTVECPQLILKGSSERIEVALVAVDLLKSKYSSNPYVKNIHVQTVVSPVLVPYNNGQVVGFYANTAGIPYSDKILKKSLGLLGGNASLASYEQKIALEQLLCSSQLKMLEDEFLRVLKDCKEVEKTVPCPGDCLAQLDPIIPPAQGWKDMWNVFAGILLPLLGFLIIAFLALLALYYLIKGLFNGYKRQDAEDDSAHVKSIASEPRSSCTCTKEIITSLGAVAEKGSKVTFDQSLPSGEKLSITIDKQQIAPKEKAPVKKNQDSDKK
ncbi:MAG: hypothetical protein LRY41_03560 [Candidatus Pacebacteria bacterium]|nr:hypothetical protein [Candidatus Paceibacterota bacterium]